MRQRVLRVVVVPQSPLDVLDAVNLMEEKEREGGGEGEGGKQRKRLD